MRKTKSGKAATPDKLAKVGKKTGVELNEIQLGKVTGGIFAGVDGESTHVDHKGEIG